MQKNTNDWNDLLCPHHCNKQCETFPIGSFVYWLSNYPVNNASICLCGRNYLCFGEVVEHYGGQTTIQLYDYRDRRVINGVPANEFETPTRWQKLPKGWTYNTELMHLTYELPSESETVFSVMSTNSFFNEEVLKQAIHNGFLVKMQENDYGEFEVEIDKHKGWRIIRQYRNRKYHAPYLTVPFNKLCKTPKEVDTQATEITKELMRQAALSDVEWSIEQIDDTLNRWAYLYSIPDDTKQKYRDYILQFDNIEDVEIRLYCGNIEWKHWKKKKWQTIKI